MRTDRPGKIITVPPRDIERQQESLKFLENALARVEIEFGEVPSPLIVAGMSGNYLVVPEGHAEDSAFSVYQKNAHKTSKYKPVNDLPVIPALGLNGEAGEVAEKIKKAIRDGIPDQQIFVEQIVKELGDVLWYISEIATFFAVDLQTVADTNIEKLKHRKINGTIHGSGDER